jgi:hypothetical protein
MIFYMILIINNFKSEIMVLDVKAWENYFEPLIADNLKFGDLNNEIEYFYWE